MAGVERGQFYLPKAPERRTARKRYLIDFIIIGVVGTLLLVTTIICVQSTGTNMWEGQWYSLQANPGNLVRLTIETNEHPATILIVEADTLDHWDSDFGGPPENAGVFEIPPNSTETIEFRLPDSDEFQNWGFMIYDDAPRNVVISYKQSRPFVFDHIFDTYLFPMSLLVLLVTCLGVNHYLRRTASIRFYQ